MVETVSEARRAVDGGGAAGQDVSSSNKRSFCSSRKVGKGCPHLDED